MTTEDYTVTPVKIVYCPKCNQKIETDADSIRAGIVCPTCGTGFIPHKVETELKYPTIPIPATSVEQNAGQLSRLSVCFIVLGFIIVLLSGYVGATDGDAWGTFYTGLGFFCGGLWLLGLAQLFHIRAALEKKSGE